LTFEDCQGRKIEEKPVFLEWVADWQTVFVFHMAALSKMDPALGL
jgi:hypothetical protein